MPDLPATRFPNWYPDPTGRSGHRYFDGGTWTEHVFADGRQGTDPLLASVEPTAGPPSTQPPVGARPARVVPLDDDAGAGDLRTAHVLLVGVGTGDDDRPVHDQQGRRIGTVRMVRPLTARLARMLVTGEPASSCRVQVLDAEGGVVAELAKPARPMRVRMPVTDGQGGSLGMVAQDQAVGSARFSLVVDGEAVGAIDADRWDDGRIDVVDRFGRELARITRTWEVLAETRFTPADTSVVQLAAELTGPLRSLVLAAALSVDTALRPA